MEFGTVAAEKYEFPLNLLRNCKKVLRATSNLVRNPEIIAIDARKLLRNEASEPEIGTFLVDSILKPQNFARKPAVSQENEESSRRNERLVRSLESKKQEINKKLVVDVVSRRLLRETQKFAEKRWSPLELQAKEAKILRKALENFKSLAMSLNKASSEHILQGNSLRKRAGKQQEIRKEIVSFDKEEEKRLNNLKQELEKSLKRNLKDFDEYQREIKERNTNIHRIRLEICNCRKIIGAQFGNVQALIVIFMQFFVFRSKKFECNSMRWRTSLRKTIRKTSELSWIGENLLRVER